MDSSDRFKRVIELWQAPQPSTALDYRLLASYRRAMLDVPWWRRVLKARISVPVPAGAMLMLCAVVAVAWREIGGWQRAPLALQHTTQAPCEMQPTPAPSDLRSVVVAGASDGATYVTEGDFSGFRPVKNATITIETKGGPQ